MVVSFITHDALSGICGSLLNLLWKESVFRVAVVKLAERGGGNQFICNQASVYDHTVCQSDLLGKLNFPTRLMYGTAMAMSKGVTRYW